MIDAKIAFDMTENVYAQKLSNAEAVIEKEKPKIEKWIRKEISRGKYKLTIYYTQKEMHKYKTDFDAFKKKLSVLFGKELGYRVCCQIDMDGDLEVVIKWNLR